MEAVNGRQLVRRFCDGSGGRIRLGSEYLDRRDFRRICIVGAGKAVAAMGEGLLDSLQPLRAGGLPLLGQLNLVDDQSGGQGTARQRLAEAGIHLRDVRPADTNLPTGRAVQATRSMLELVRSLQQDDLLIVLLSGGGSALLSAPLPGLKLSDKLKAIECLTSAGADIVQLNTLRAALSQVKQGGLIRDCRCGRIRSLILSDIAGDPVHLIAGGPTVAHAGSTEAARQIARQFDPHHDRLPTPVREILEQPAPPVATRAVAGSVRHYVIGNLQTAVAAAVRMARSLGYPTASAIEAASPLAEDEGRRLLDWIASRPSSECLVSGGEPVVRLAPLEIRGRGGRNQQLVLSALSDSRLRMPRGGDWCLLSAGSDGQDGNTLAAGAWVNPQVVDQVACQSLDLRRALQTNNAETVFQATRSLLETGPTHTNVGDLRIAIAAE